MLDSVLKVNWLLILAGTTIQTSIAAAMPADKIVRQSETE
ncbi:hypothetical protein N644_1644 [Lactiplantibacillus paraplantarum]|nr:hypothetical protein N644_1644 [Lactiplantibacillus paraplantarum]